MTEKYMNLKKGNKNLRSLQLECAKLKKKIWENEKFDFKKIMAEKMETQRVKTENSDFIQKISDLRHQVRETPVFIQPAFI